MMKLAEERGVEAYIAKTPSFEYWDEMPSRGKIDSMAEYLQDVSLHLRRSAHLFRSKKLMSRTVHYPPPILPP
jgi:hypothetical protein